MSQPATNRTTRTPLTAITTWNVNSINTLKQYHPWCDLETFSDILERLKADIVCFQEVKLTKLQSPDIAVPTGWDAYFSLSRQRRGQDILVHSYSSLYSFIHPQAEWKN